MTYDQWKTTNRDDERPKVCPDCDGEGTIEVFDWPDDDNTVLLECKNSRN